MTTYTNDDLGRVTYKAIARGPGVTGTTEEAYAYDGLDRVVAASNTVVLDFDPLVTPAPVEMTLVGRSYDSRSNLLAETTHLEFDSGGRPAGAAGGVQHGCG